MLGKPLMPWQQYVVDVLGEIDPETGRFAYSEFGLTVPRQSGKSTLVLAKAVHRAEAEQFFGRRQAIIYTAQTRKDARKKFEEDYAGVLSASKTFRSRADQRWGNGNEHIRFPNGSRFGIEASTEKAGHGPVLDEAYIDEAFAQVDGRLEQAFRPAMITRSNKQLGWISTAGWLDGSPFLQAKRQKGLEAVEADSREGLAYFEWSAPEDADPEDPDTWRACMPALGYTITEEAIAHEFASMEVADFRRAFLNQWVSKNAGEPTVIDLQKWSNLADPASQPVDPVAFSVDVTPDRSTTTIAIAGRRSDGAHHTEVVDNLRGTGWVPKRMAELVDRWNPTCVVLDASGPVGSLMAPLTAAGVETMPISTREMGQACGSFYDMVQEGRLHHIGQPVLNTALGAARKRRLGDAWAWSRRDTTDISPLVAVTLALYGFDQAATTKKRTGNVWA